MKIDEAMERIKELQNFIQKIESYHADTFEKKSVYLYVQLESVTNVAIELNKKGYKVGNRKVIGKDVSDIIRDKPIDDMHVMAKRLFNNNKKRSQKRGWL